MVESATLKDVQLAWNRVIPPLLLLVSITAFYLPSANNDFVYDDYTLIVDQPRPHSFGDVFRVFGERHWYNLPYYRPVSRLTMVVQMYLHGAVPAPYHVFNAVVMGAISVAAYLLLHLPTWNIPRPVAALVAALFALHPAAAVTVFPICSGRETSIVTLFILASMYAFMRVGRFWYGAAMFLLCLALLSKEQAILLPLLFVWSDMLGLSDAGLRDDWRQWLKRYLPVACIVAAYFLIRWMLFAGTGEHKLAIIETPWRPLASFAFALQTAILPYLEFRYEPQRIDAWFSSTRLGIALAILGIIVMQARAQWSSLRARLWFWIGWIVLALLPTANILKQDAIFADRYIFMSILGLGAIVALLVGAHWHRVEVRKAFWLIGIAAILCCGIVSFNRSIYFQNDDVFLSQWVRTDPKSPQARLSLGIHLLERQEFEAALQQLNIALQLAPNPAPVHEKLAVTLQGLGDIDAALQHSLLSVQLDPNNAGFHNTLGVLLANQGDIVAAAQQFRQAIRLEPTSIEAHRNLGRASLEQNQHEQADVCFRRTIELNPDDAAAYAGLGDALIAQDKFTTASEQYNHALQIDPLTASAYIGLGLVSESQGRVLDAERLYKRALAINPSLTRARENLERIRRQSRDQ